MLDGVGIDNRSAHAARDLFRDGALAGARGASDDCGSLLVADLFRRPTFEHRANIVNHLFWGDEFISAIGMGVLLLAPPSGISDLLPCDQGTFL